MHKYSTAARSDLSSPLLQPTVLTLAETESVSGGTWASGPGAPQPPPGNTPAPNGPDDPGDHNPRRE
jgi:hypothetical protein